MALVTRFRVWVIDNKAGSFDLVKRSAGEPDFIEFRHIPTGEEFLEEMNANIFNPDRLPHLVLMDFFLGSMFANELIPKFMQIFETTPEFKPYLIAFATMDNANKAMVELGAEWSILKIKDADVLDEVRELLGNEDTIKKQLGLATG